MPRRKRPAARTMPAQTRHLYTYGHLTPEAARALGVRVMRCTRCQGETTLVCTFQPVPQDEIETRKLPPLRWGEEVMVVCPCCSFEGCAHGKGGEA